MPPAPATLTCDEACGLIVALCGNGLVEAGETCDDSNDVPGDGCDAACAEEPIVCGDGLVFPGETCDDGNAVAGDGCSAACDVEPGWCGPVTPVQCGDVLTIDDVTTAALVDSYACDPWMEIGPEVSFDLTLPAARRVTLSLTAGAPGIDPEIVVIPDAGGGCDPLACLPGYYDPAATPAPWSFDAFAGLTYHVIVDQFLLGQSYPFVLQIDCGPEAACGDGIVGVGEACDDGAAVDGDGCAADCSAEAGSACVGEPSICATSFALCGTSMPGVVLANEDPVGTMDVVVIAPPAPGDTCQVAAVTLDVDLGGGNVGEVALRLASPDGTTVELLASDPCLINPLGPMTFTRLDLANYTTTRPALGSFFDFNGTDGLGAWTLTAADEIDTFSPGAAPVTLVAWTLDLICIP